MPAQDRQRRRPARTRTPAGAASTEPADATSTQEGLAGQGGRFVVQRHRATRLHYDFRLEVDGVLVSWAVPRGPTLDPSARRMAVHVDDHPMEYLHFEGVIPGGQYGAGDVIVWDSGTWEPEAETPDPGPAIGSGELKFVLNGEKLRGRFVLVRTSPRAGAERGAASAPPGNSQWLLIHKHDEHAQAGWDAEDHPHSVLSGHTNDEVRAEPPALWVSADPADRARIDLARAVVEPMPSFIPPMQLTLSSATFTDPDWLFEVKWDGYRVEAVVREGTVRLFTRNGNDADDYFPSLLEPPTWIAADQAILDGEVVALDPAGRPDFNLLQERIPGARGGPVTGLVFEVFDLLHLDGRSLLSVPLEERKKLLRLVLRDGPTVRYAGHIEAEGDAVLAAAKQQGLEGIVAKHRRSTYAPGQRTPTWLKIKLRLEQELVVCGWTPASGGGRDLGALVVGVHEDGALRFAGKVGSGFSARARAILLARLDPLTTQDPPFDPPPEPARRGRWGGTLDGVVWVRPEVVIRAELGGWSREGLVRQAAYKGLDLDRNPHEVAREHAVDADQSLPRELTEPSATSQATTRTPGAARTPGVPRYRPAPSPLPGRPWSATDAELDALAALPSRGTWQVGGQALALTNLDKVLFPPRAGTDAAPVTKRELIEYFVRIAPAMLPHLADRPVNLHRFPNGVDAPGFWQKAIPSSAPAWLTTWHETGVDERAGRTANDHLVADSVSALAWLANQAAFEVHAWTSVCGDPGRPTFALVDIDPGPATSWADTLTLARLYGTALDHLGLRGFPKTTGSRGIQVWIPVTRGRYDFGATSAWVERLSRAIGATVPDLVSWEWATRSRGGRARLDYTQNSPIKTLVAPYAVRPHPGAPVSMPISWDELDDPDLRSNRWTIRDAVDRVAERGDLFAAAQVLEQDLPPL